MIISAQSSGPHATNSSAWTAMPQLSIKIPGGAGEMVLLILNVPNPYASGNNFPGGNFGIEVAGTVQPATATFTYTDSQPTSPGRIPTTLCVPFLVNSRESFGCHGGVVECSRLDRAHRQPSHSVRCRRLSFQRRS